MRKILPLFVAVVFAVLAIAAVRNYIQGVEQNSADLLKGDAVIAVRYPVALGDEITTEMLTTKDVPKRFQPSQVIGKAELSLILGRKTRVSLSAGQVLLWSDLASEQQGGFASMVPENHRAFTIEVNRGMFPGLIKPNDRVDILASFAMPKPQVDIAQAEKPTWLMGSEMVNVVLLQNVLVLAVGNSFGSADLSGDAGGADSLTVAVELAEAQTLMFASQHGELGVVLRREGELQVVERSMLPRVTFEDVEKIIGNLDAQRARRVIEIQRGSKKEYMPVVEGQANQ